MVHGGRSRRFTPLGHSPDVDLIACIDGWPSKVQVKTSVTQEDTPSGLVRHRLQIATNGGNQSWTGRVKSFDPDGCDLMFAHVGDGRRWLIPAQAIEGKVAVSLGGPKYSEFEIEPGRSLEDLVYGVKGAPLQSSTAQGECPSGQREQTVNLPAYAYAGSNPASPIASDRPSYERRLGRSRQAVIWPKRRITIPLAPFEEAGLGVGDRVRVEADPRGLLIERINENGPPGGGPFQQSLEEGG